MKLSVKAIFTEHSRVISLQYELGDDQDVPISERFHKAFYSFQFQYQYLIHQLSQEHEPWKDKMYVTGRRNIDAYSMNNVGETVTKNNITTIFDVKVRLAKRK